MSNKVDLVTAVRMAAALAPGRAPLPGASCVLLAPGEDQQSGIVVKATNLETQITIPVDGQIIGGPVLVPSRLLLRTVRWMQSPKLAVLPRSRQLTLSVENATVTIEGIDPVEGWPGVSTPLEDPQEIPFDAEAFRWTAHNASTEDSRPILTGVAINKKTGAMAASDGFRLRVHDRPWKTAFSKDDSLHARGTSGGTKLPKHWPAEPVEVVLPASIAMWLPPNIERAMMDRHCQTFNTGGAKPVERVVSTAVEIVGDWTLRVKTLEGSFPQFMALIPDWSEYQTHATIEPAYMLAATRLLNEIAKDGSGILRLQFEGKSLTMSARAEEYAHGELTVPLAEEVPAGRVAINGGYLQNALRGIEAGAFSLRVKGPSDQVGFVKEGRCEIVMPMFVQW
jgi:DNA polymerase III sliding clamp (beta) subunit (PCNA family)